MRTIGLAAISLAMMAPDAMASGAPAPEPVPPAPVQSEQTPGRYATQWGEATVAFDPRGGGTIKFADGSEIWGNFSAGTSGRFIGYWARARRAGGLQPAGTSWASRCDTPPPVRPSSFVDTRTPYWGTVLVTFRANEFTAYFNSCRGLPHSTGSQREGLHGKLLGGVSRYTPEVVRGLGPDLVLQALRERRVPNCGAQPSAVALPSSCQWMSGRPLSLIVQRDLVPGYHIRLTPVVSNAALVGDAISNRRRPPTRSGVAPIRMNPENGTTLRRSQHITLQHTRDLCRSDIWLVDVITTRGGAYPYSGVVITDCGPRDGRSESGGISKN